MSSSVVREPVRYFRNALYLSTAVAGLSLSHAAQAFEDDGVAADSSVESISEDVQVSSEANDGQVDTDDGGMEVIVVTARKREENLQDTPISITAFSEGGLESRQIQKISGVAQMTPALTFEEAAPISGNSAVAVLFIRGIGQVESIPTVDLGVGLYVDGVYLARSVGGVLDLVDAERVEVLRGPQGTLFGRNTIGGAISITSKKPDEYWSGQGSILYGTDNKVVAKGSLNTPLADNLFLKSSVAYTLQDGYVSKPANGRDTGDQNRLSLRSHLRATPTDNLEFNLIFDATRERTNGAAYVLVDTNVPGLAPVFPDGSPTPFPQDQKAALFPFFFNEAINAGVCGSVPPPPNAPFSNPPLIPQCFGQHYVPPNRDTDFSNLNNFSNLDIWGVSFTADLDLGPVQLKSITSYRETRSSYNLDQDHSPLLIAEVLSTNNQEQFTQELQLLGQAFDDRLSYIIGAFYFQEKALTVEDVTFAPVDFRSGGSVDNDSIAGFAQATFDITDSLSVTGGIRYTRDQKRFAPDQFVRANGLGIPVGFPIIATIQNGVPVIAPEDKLTFKRWTPMFNISYKVNPDVLLYATYSEGFKSGGFTQRLFPPTVLNPGQTVGDVFGFSPEIAKVYEGGFKADMFDRKVRLNGALYHTDYSGVQVTVQNVTVAPLILNAAQAEIFGGELEATIIPVEGGLLEFGIGYIDADFKEIAPGAQVQVTDQFIKTPEWTFNAGASYEILLNDSWSMTPRVDWSYRSRTENNSINSPQISQPGYHLLDAGITFENDSGFAVIARLENITNERYITGAFSDDISLGLSEAVLDRGREWSITLRKKF